MTTAAQPRQISINKFGPASGLALESASLAPLGADDVRVAVRYSGVNFADVQMRLGFYPDAPSKPFVPGYEVSGHIDAVGKNVEHLHVGDPIVAGTYFGGYASHVTIPARQAFALPKNADLAAGAALPVNFFTAQIALMEMSRMRAGDKVLIECATGGVGTIAIQMARHVGAEVVGLTTSPAKLDYIRELGATAYTREQFNSDASIKGFDIIINASGGSSIKRQIDRLAITGRIVCLGMNSGVKDGRRNYLRMAKAVIQTPRLSILKLFGKNAGVYALNALHVLRDETWIERLMKAFPTVDEMKIEPHIHKIYPAAEVAAAHQTLETRKALGKVLLEW